MKLILLHILQASVVVMLALGAAAIASDPTHDAFTYQGELKHNGDPVAGPVNFAFRLYDAAVAGGQVGPELASLGFDAFDKEGRFTIDLAFGKAIFDGTPLWLEIEVDAVTLTPRQPIMPTPYSIRALNVAAVQNSALLGTYTNALNLTNAGNQFSGSGAGLTALNASNISTGTLGSSLLSGTYGNALTLNNNSNIFAGSGAGLTALNASNITTGTLSAERLPVPLTLVGTSTQHIILGVNFSASANSSGIAGLVTGGIGDTYAVYGENGSFNGTGVRGLAWADTSDTFGVRGESISTTGTGVFGWASASNGLTEGVRGNSDSTSGTGVHGWATAGGGSTYGVRGVSDSTSGTGVFGFATTGAGSTYGVRGESASTSGQGVFAWASADTGATYGVRALSNSTSGHGVLGWANANSGTTFGIRGQVNSPTGYAGYFTGGRNYFEGRVGIGTSNPGAGLHVEGGTFPNAFIFLNATAAAGDAGFRLNRQGNVKWHVFNSGANDLLGIYNTAFSPVIVATQAGNVGIGTTAPAQLLSVNGTAGKPGGGSWATFSDARLKKNIQPLTGSLDRLLALDGVVFEYLDPDTIQELPGKRIGMIAQDVEKIFPDWVTEGASGYKSLSFSGFEALTVEALRELRDEKDAEIAALRAHNEELEQRLARLEAILFEQNYSKGDSR